MELTRTLTLLILLTLSASAQTPRIPPPEAVNRNGLVGRWLVPGYQTGNGLTPTKVNDASGNGNHGTTAAAPNYGRIYSRDAMLFNGSSQYVQMGNKLNNLQVFTLTAWVFDAAPNDTGRVIQSVSYNGRYSWRCRVNGGYAYMETSEDGLYGGYDAFHYVPYPVFVTHKTNTWNHFAFTYTQGSKKLNVNGKLVATGTTTPTSLYYNSGLTFALAVNNYPGPPLENYFSGNLSDVRVYNRVVSASEIALIHRGLQ
jgi:hypothetical protein